MNFEQFFIASSDQDAKLRGTVSAHVSEVAPDILETLECKFQVFSLLSNLHAVSSKCKHMLKVNLGTLTYFSRIWCIACSYNLEG